MPQRPKNTGTTLIESLAVLCLLPTVSNSALAASAEGSVPGSWNVVIVLFVLAATAGSGVLNVAAIRQWDRNWGLVSALPLFGLLVWCLVIVLARQLDPGAHGLWPLEIFAWAMLNMIYMVTAMTAKRMFAKRDAENSEV